MRAAFAHDAPVIAPTRLDFDASQAPKDCNDRIEFLNLLSHWMPTVMVDDAKRQLVVRIRRSPTGAKLVDVTLVDAADATNRKHHEQFSAKVECHRVLHETAYTAAKLLGAFDKPPPPAPLVCPMCPPSLASAKPAPCPSCPALAIQPPRMTISTPPIPRFSLGAGVFVGMTNRPEAHPGPYVALNVVPFSGVPDFRLEFDCAWAPRKTQQTVPIFVSLCHAHHGLRLCGGLATTFLLTEPLPETRETGTLHTTLAGSFRMGIEFVMVGPVSIRADMFTLLRFTERTFGPTFARLDMLSAVHAGAAVMGVWSFK